MKTRTYNHVFPVLIVLAFLALILSPARAQEPLPPPPPAKDYFPNTWEEYSSKDGKFRVRFPKQPQEFVSTLGQLQVNGLKYKGLLTYEVYYADYKASAVDPQKVKALLQGIKTYTLDSMKDKELKVVAEREVTVDGRDGVFIHVEVQGKEVLRILWVIVGQRLYFVSAVSRKGSPMEMEGKDDFEKVAMGFINSFHIVP